MSQALVNIGSLITISPEIQSGRPIIAGTGTSVQRIVTLNKQGYPSSVSLRTEKSIGFSKALLNSAIALVIVSIKYF